MPRIWIGCCPAGKSDRRVGVFICAGYPFSFSPCFWFVCHVSLLLLSRNKKKTKNKSIMYASPRTHHLPKSFFVSLALPRASPACHLRGAAAAMRALLAHIPIRFRYHNCGTLLNRELNKISTKTSGFFLQPPNLPGRFSSVWKERPPHRHCQRTTRRRIRRSS